LGKKSGPAPPPPPDPYATAAAQTQENQQTAVANAELNRINQYTPYGNLTYQVTGSNPDGTPIYAQTTTLAPAQQQQLDLQNKLATALLGFGTDQLGRVQTTMNTPFNFNNAPGQVSSIDLSRLPQMVSHVRQPDLTRNIADAGSIQRGLGNAGNIVDGFGNAGDMQRTIDGLPGVQTSLDYRHAPGLPGVGDFSADRSNVTDALYRQATSRLDPRFRQDQSDLDAKLANMGIVRGSDAWNREEGNLSNQRNDAYDQALYSAIGAGGDEQSRLFGLALNARQQAVGETNTQGQFANAADLQRYQEKMGTAGLYNDTQGQLFQQLMATGQFANEAEAQRFAQMLSSGSFFNQAQQQRYDQNSSNAAFYNASGESMFQQMLANAGLANSTNQQAYNEAAGNAALTNQARQEAITEQTYLRNLPLQDIATLMGTAGAPQSPTFQPVANVGMANTDLGQMVYDSYNGQFNNWNAQQQQTANSKGQMFGALGSVGGAVAASDRRLKHSVQPIGELWNGVKTYAYSYIGETRRRFGVMADEVMHIPGAVLSTPDGVKLVDYRKVW
jgi:hypothetical protein